jgi:hypothetical protein
LSAHYVKLFVSFFSSTAAWAMHVLATLSADLSFSNYIASMLFGVLHLGLVVVIFLLYRKQQELESSFKLLQGELNRNHNEDEAAAAARPPPPPRHNAGAGAAADNVDLPEAGNAAAAAAAA